MADRLARFSEAQAACYDTVLSELHAGEKRTHWMWFVFPQIAGLGRSPTARHYAIADLAEAEAYLAHPTLGPRLNECTDAVLAHDDKSAEAIFGATDAMKLRSSATLFREAGGGARFQSVLDRFFGGEPCDFTLRTLSSGRGRLA